MITHKIEENTVTLFDGEDKRGIIVDGGIMQINNIKPGEGAKFAKYCRKNDIAYTPKLATKKKAKPKKEVTVKAEIDKEKEIEILKQKIKELTESANTNKPSEIKQTKKSLSKGGLSFNGNDTIYPGPFNNTLGVRCPDWQKWCKENAPHVLEYLKSEGKI